jgi:hypothetical protein
MIAEHGDGRRAEPLHEPQHVERARPAVHEVADEPELVPAGIEADAVDEAAQLVVTALHVADGVDRHPPKHATG